MQLNESEVILDEDEPLSNMIRLPLRREKCGQRHARSEDPGSGGHVPMEAEAWGTPLQAKERLGL